jgi:hypothetical protein
MGSQDLFASAIPRDGRSDRIEELRRQDDLLQQLSAPKQCGFRNRGA